MGQCGRVPGPLGDRGVRAPRGRTLRVVLLLVLLAGVARAGETLAMFTWVDKRGGIHITDRLRDVPEPFYSIYLAQQRERQAQQRQGPPPTGAKTPAKHHSQVRARPRPSSQGIVLAEERRREQWQALMKQWRVELLAATQGLQKEEEALQRLRVNPLLAETPPVKAQIAAQQEQVAVARERVLKARTMLLEKLPAKAKNEQVPPKWLL